MFLKQRDDLQSFDIYERSVGNGCAQTVSTCIQQNAAVEVQQKTSSCSKTFKKSEIELLLALAVRDLEICFHMDILG